MIGDLDKNRLNDLFKDSLGPALYCILDDHQHDNTEDTHHNHDNADGITSAPSPGGMVRQ
jgi:hypothetical protein